jgi:predicted acylesterase/phospholipase RssA
MLDKYYGAVLSELLELGDIENNLFFVPENINYNEASWFSYLPKLLTKNNNSKDFEDIIGSSANAILTLLLGLGYTTEEIYQKFNDVVFQKILKNTGNKDNKPLSIIMDFKTSPSKTIAHKKQFRLSAKDDFLSWTQAQINNKLNNPMATFENLNAQIKKQANFKNIHLIGLNIETGRLEIFNCKNTPNMPIAVAVRICMSCSTAFPVVEIIDSVTLEKNVYVDGGLILQHIDFSKYKKAS